MLPEEGLVFGQVAYEDGRPIGFVAVTDDANGFLGTALRRRWRTLAAVTLRHPPSPRKAWNVLRLFRDRESASGDVAVAEILSMGVLPPEPGQRPSRERRRIARNFVQWAVEHVADRPIQALVDESNLAARLMYGELGWDVVGKVEVGWPVPQLVYQTPQAPARPPDRKDCRPAGQKGASVTHWGPLSLPPTLSSPSLVPSSSSAVVPLPSSKW